MIEKNIEKKAQELLKKLGISTQPIPIEEILKSMQIEVGMAPSKEFSGLLIRKNSSQALIGINTSESYERQRFTMGHELGHFLFDTHKDAFVDRLGTISAYRDNKRGIERPKEEVIANKFAAALLMPAAMVKKSFTEISGKNKIFLEDHLELLAKQYLVSKNAMKFRLANLGLIRLPS